MPTKIEDSVEDLVERVLEEERLGKRLEEAIDEFVTPDLRDAVWSSVSMVKVQLTKPSPRSKRKTAAKKKSAAKPDAGSSLFPGLANIPDHKLPRPFRDYTESRRPDEDGEA